MAQQSQTRKIRQATPERWQRALQRALFAGVEAKQIAGSGEWIVSSASRPGTAYRTDGVSCDCEAAMLGGDAVCLHRAAYWYAAGVLDLDPEPDPPAPICFKCQGRDVGCPVCAGAGIASLSVQAAALVAAADTPATDRMVAEGGPGAASEYVGRAGHVAGYDVFLSGDTMLVTHAASGRKWRHVVPNFGTALADLARQPGLRLGWASFPDDSEAICCYDAEDGNFGYALNLSDPALSEWGYAPFASDNEETCDECGGPLNEDAERGEALTLCGACVERQRQAAWAARQAAISANHAATVRAAVELLGA